MVIHRLMRRRFFCQPCMLVILLVGPQAVQGQSPLNRSAALEKPSGGVVKPILHVPIPAEASGQIRNMPIAEGMLVQEGDLLAELDNVEATLAYHVAHFEHLAAAKEAENDIKVRAAEAADKVKTVEVEIAEEANRKEPNSVTKMELNRLGLDAEHAKLQTEQSIFQFDVSKLTEKVQFNKLELAKQELRKRRIKAPFSGMVQRYEKHLGEWVQVGEPVLYLLRMDRLYVTRMVDAREYPQYTMLNRAVEVTVGGQTVRSVIDYFDPLVDVNQRYMVRCEIENKMVGSTFVIYPGLDAEMKILNQ